MPWAVAGSEFMDAGCRLPVVRWLPVAGRRMPDRSTGCRLPVAGCRLDDHPMTLQQLLGIELPIIQAPMAGVQGSALAVAVSKPRTGLPPVRAAVAGRCATSWNDPSADISAFTTSISSATGTPTPHRARGRVASRARAVLPEFRLDRAIRFDRSRTPFDDEAAEVLERSAAVVSFHFGLPTPELLARVAGWGARCSQRPPRRRSALARGARRRRDHRAGTRSGRPSRDVSHRTYQQAVRYALRRRSSMP